MYIGDDLNNLEVVQGVGFGYAVSDAMSEVKVAAKNVIEYERGNSAVHEVADFFLVLTED